MFDLLIHATNYSSPTNGMRCAAQLANLLGGSVTGIFISEPIIPIGPAGIAPVAPAMYVAAAQIVEEARQAEPVFQRWATGQGIAKFRWQVASGMFSSALASAANWHDAVVFDCGSSTPWNSVGLLGQALVSCGAPCFVVPETFAKAMSLDTIVVASHGSPEAIRAVHAALPLLARAKRVVLVKGRPAGLFSPVDFRPAFTVEDHLQRHGIAFDTRVLDATDKRTGAEILGAAEEVAADLLVMGAYGHTRFSEWALGGVTRHALEHARLPLFVRH